MLPEWMPPWIYLAIAAVLYLLQSGEYFQANRWAMGFCFIGYSIANIALIVDFIKYQGGAQ